MNVMKWCADCRSLLSRIYFPYIVEHSHDFQRLLACDAVSKKSSEVSTSGFSSWCLARSTQSNISTGCFSWPHPLHFINDSIRKKTWQYLTLLLMRPLLYLLPFRAVNRIQSFSFSANSLPRTMSTSVKANKNNVSYNFWRGHPNNE